jgi:xylose dehydrogenase (NAD/NADP)
MATSPVKWGIVSTANINQKVIPGAKESARVDLVGVASRTQERADAYASEWEIPRAYGSYEALLGDPEIEAVYISLPNTLHVEWTIKAL